MPIRLASPRRWVLLPCILLITTASIPMEAADPLLSRDPSSAKRAFFALSTGNFDRLVAWYRDNLGFTVDSSRTTEAGVRGALLSRPAALLEILQLPSAKSRAAWKLPENPDSLHGILKIGFEVAALDTLYTGAKERRLTIFFAPTRPDGASFRTFALKDPDGNIVQLFGQ